MSKMEKTNRNGIVFFESKRTVEMVAQHGLNSIEKCARQSIVISILFPERNKKNHEIKRLTFQL